MTKLLKEELFTVRDSGRRRHACSLGHQHDRSPAATFHVNVSGKLPEVAIVEGPHGKFLRGLVCWSEQPYQRHRRVLALGPLQCISWSEL